MINLINLFVLLPGSVDHSLRLTLPNLDYCLSNLEVCLESLADYLEFLVNYLESLTNYLECGFGCYTLNRLGYPCPK